LNQYTVSSEVVPGVTSPEATESRAKTQASLGAVAVGFGGGVWGTGILLASVVLWSKKVAALGLFPFLGAWSVSWE
jgi:hypothetical protein